MAKKVLELKTYELHYATGRAWGIIPASIRIDEDLRACLWQPHVNVWKRWVPTMRWDQAGPILQNALQDGEGLYPMQSRPGHYAVQLKKNGWVTEHKYMLVALCQCFVLETYGEEVPFL